MYTNGHVSERQVHLFHCGPVYFEDFRVVCCFQETSVRSCSNVKLSVGGAPLDPNDPLDNVGT